MWITETNNGWFHEFCCKILKAGSIPSHLAFIMDGNRRFSKKMGHSCLITGHAAGFEKLAETLEWCRDLNIKEVTVYAFSIENFKRSREEVDDLMELAESKFEELLKERSQIEKHKVCIRFFGNLSLLPEKMQILISKIAVLTRNNAGYFLNVCLAYTAQDEISRAIQHILCGVERGLLDASDISELLITKCLDTGHSPDPELLLRTSGEYRFSDFLLWQCTNSCLYFDKVLWPEFSFWHLCLGILHYQRNAKMIEKLTKSENRSLCPSGYPIDVSVDALPLVDEKAHWSDSTNSECLDNDNNQLSSNRVNAFLTWLDNDKWERMEELASKFTETSEQCATTSIASSRTSPRLIC